MARNNIKYIVYALSTGFAGFLARHQLKRVPEPVERIDLRRYMGRWYEIAKLPKRFEEGCRNVVADYKLLNDGTVKVVNSCTLSDGTVKTVRGKAWVAHPGKTSLLRVQIIWPFSADYRVIGIDPDYRFAVVSNRAASSLWILSRTPEMSADLKAKAYQVASRYVDVRRLQVTEQDLAKKAETIETAA